MHSRKTLTVGRCKKGEHFKEVSLCQALIRRLSFTVHCNKRSEEISCASCFLIIFSCITLRLVSRFLAIYCVQLITFTVWHSATRDALASFLLFFLLPARNRVTLGQDFIHQNLEKTKNHHWLPGWHQGRTAALNVIYSFNLIFFLPQGNIKEKCLCLL